MVACPPGVYSDNRDTGTMMIRSTLTWLIAMLIMATAVVHAEPHIILPKHRIEAHELAIIVNEADPLSRRIGAYYQQRRGIPEANLIRVRFDPHRKQMSPAEFAAIKQAVDAATPAQVQAYALTWVTPWRVGCMSITSAFTFGFDKAWCSSQRCAATRVSPYFDSGSAAPFDDLGIRPTIVLAAIDFAAARALIDRGISADGSRPDGTAYLLSTSDRARNVRHGIYAEIVRRFSPLLRIEVLEADTLRGRDDVLFYFTGLTQVENLDTLHFVPGAIADHLTSAGGVLIGGRQMSALRWLEAGATGSYGTVVEPCNLPGKFPNPGLVMQHYLRGATLIEAYWKSVQMPGEGLFIGEPLAAPFDFLEITRRDGALVVETWSLAPGLYRLEAAPTVVGPYRPVARVPIGFPVPPLRLPDSGSGVLRLVPTRPAD